MSVLWVFFLPGAPQHYIVFSVEKIGRITGVPAEKYVIAMLRQPCRYIMHSKKNSPLLEGKNQKDTTLTSGAQRSWQSRAAQTVCESKTSPAPSSRRLHAYSSRSTEEPTVLLPQPPLLLSLRLLPPPPRRRLAAAAGARQLPSRRGLVPQWRRP